MSIGTKDKKERGIELENLRKLIAYLAKQKLQCYEKCTDKAEKSSK